MLWSLPSVYKALLEKEKDNAYFIAAYAVMEPSVHSMNTMNAPDWMKFCELSHRTVYKEPQIVARKLGLVQAAAQYRFHLVPFPFNPVKSYVLYRGLLGYNVGNLLGRSHYWYRGDIGEFFEDSVKPSWGFFGLSQGDVSANSVEVDLGAVSQWVSAWVSGFSRLRNLLLE